MDAEILAEYRRITGEIKRNREALEGLLARIKQPDGSLKLTKEARAAWVRLDKEYVRDRKALKKLIADQPKPETAKSKAKSDAARAKAAAPAKSKVEAPAKA